MGCTVAAVLLMGIGPAVGAEGENEDILVYDFGTVLADPQVAAKLAPGVNLFFDNEPAEVASDLGPAQRLRRRLRPTRTPLSEACIRTAGNLLISLTADAKARGGNALVGIRSNYRDRPSPGPRKFECSIGSQSIGVHVTGVVAVTK
jgi:hypothetical protein